MSAETMYTGPFGMGREHESPVVFYTYLHPFHPGMPMFNGYYLPQGVPPMMHNGYQQPSAFLCTEPWGLYQQCMGPSQWPCPHQSTGYPCYWHPAFLPPQVYGPPLEHRSNIPQRNRWRYFSSQGIECTDENAQDLLDPDACIFVAK